MKKLLFTVLSIISITSYSYNYDSERPLSRQVCSTDCNEFGCTTVCQ